MSEQVQSSLATQVTVSQATRMITTAIRAKKVVMLEGSPAIGKSSIVHAIAEAHNLKVIDMRLSQCDPVDLNGFPQFINGRARYMPMETFPIEGDPLPINRATGKPYDGWILFLDEFTSAARAVQAAAYKIVLDHMVGQEHIHPKVAIVCAGNKETDGAIVEEMSTALQSRLIHLELIINVKEWIEWAVKAQVDYRIISYIGYQEHMLYTFKPDHTDKTYAAPRTWKFADDFMKLLPVTDPDLLPLLAGTISEGVAREFLLFCRIAGDLPSIAAITASPESIMVPVEPSVLFMLAGSLSSHANDSNAGQLVKFILRLPIEFQIVTLRHIVFRNPKLKQHPDIQKWLMAQATELF